MKKVSLLTYVTLSTISVGQPVLDLYGKNLTIFSASKMNGLSTALFVVAVIGIPVVLALVFENLAKLFGRLVHEAVQLLLVRGFVALFLLALLNTWHVSDDYVAIGLAMVGAYFIGRAFDRRESVRVWFQWLRIVPIVVVAVFVLQAQAIFMPPSVPLAEITVRNTDISVLQVIFDEFPLYAILDSSGNVNSERFPGLATLQREGTWYRNSGAVSNFTHQAVPSILTSSIPAQSSSPMLVSHKRNVFTLLGAAMNVNGFEPVTSLCPTKVCEHAQKERRGFDAGRFGNFLKDSLAVYGRRIAPRRIAEQLPRVDAGWGGFKVVANRFRAQITEGTLAQQDNVVTAAKELAADPAQRYELVHALMPHAPWYLTPDNRLVNVSLGWNPRNPVDVDGARDTYQRFLYQAVATDSALEKAIKELKSAGRWDNTLVIFTADHGITFRPDTPQRTTNLSQPDVIDDIYRVPTFIKYPGQSKGEISDCAVSNLDLLPTTVDVLGITTDWEFTGKSLAHGCPERTSRPIEAATGEKSVLAGGFERTLARSKFYAAMVSPDGGPRTIAAVGHSADLIGQRISTLPRFDMKIRWTSTLPENFVVSSTARGASVPAVVRGGVLMDRPLPKGSEGLLLVDGVAAGVVGEFDRNSTYFGYTAVLDYQLLTVGNHKLKLVIRNGETGQLSEVGPPEATP